MFLKNRTFSDEATLMEVLFDFDLGTPATYTKSLLERIQRDLANNKTFQDYRNTLSDDDKAELDAEERDMILSELLMKEFASFEVKDAKLFGIRDKERVLLMEMYLV